MKYIFKCLKAFKNKLKKMAFLIVNIEQHNLHTLHTEKEKNKIKVETNTAQSYSYN